MAPLLSASSSADQAAPFTINLLPEILAESSDKSYAYNSSGAGNATTAIQLNIQTAPTSRVESSSLLLAASYRTRQDNLAVPRADHEYLRQELGVDRLNKIHTWLWTVGRPMPPRALHHQKMLRREIVVTEKMDMHLVWTTDRMFIKPIPRFLLNPQFWLDHLNHVAGCTCSAASSGKVEKSAECEEARLRKCALGFLLTYAALVAHESDLGIAQESHLLSKDISWVRWKTFVQQLLNQGCIYRHINSRYIYGELRLGRLNTIYRLTGLSLISGYEPEYNQYSSFFRANFSWIASILAYVVVMLTAMQVGLTTDTLAESNSFQAASFGFTIFSIVGSLAVVTTVINVFLILFVYHWVTTKMYETTRFREIRQHGGDPKAV